MNTLSKSSTALKTMNLYGAHRGGTAATNALLNSGSLPPLQVHIVDQTPNRAGDLATTWQRAGHQTTALQADARMMSMQDNIDVLGLCTDDATAQLRLLQNSHAKLLVAGIIVASSDAGSLGGRVIGFGATVPEANRQTRADTTRLFQSIIDLTDGQRTTSTAVSYPVLNTVQMDGVRDTLYQQLAQDARTFLVSGHAPGRLYIAAAWPAPAIYRMNIQLRQGRSRSQMRTEVESRAAKTHHASATVYLDEANSRWSYIVITSSPRQSITIELPESGAMPLVREQIKREQELREQMAREQAVRESIQREEARRSTIYATD